MPFDPYALLRCKYGPVQPVFELGKKDEILEQGKFRFCYPPIKELDPLTYDRPVENSQATLRAGGDSCKESQGVGYRYMGMPIDEWRYKVLYRQNPTVKHIYDTWDISDEHPGMKFRNGIRTWFAPLDSHGHVNFLFKFHLSKILPGGKYYSSPEGEQCFVKAWTCARAFALITMPLVLHDCISGSQQRGWRNIAFQYFRISYLPVSAAWMWGAITCLTCSYRKQNDLINSFWGSVAAGAIFGMRLGTTRGIQAGFYTLVMSWLWRMAQDSGVDMFVPDDRWNTNMLDPLSHKWVMWETKKCELPPRDY